MRSRVGLDVAKTTQGLFVIARKLIASLEYTQFKCPVRRCWRPALYRHPYSVHRGGDSVSQRLGRICNLPSSYRCGCSDTASLAPLRVNRTGGIGVGSPRNVCFRPETDEVIATYQRRIDCDRTRLRFASTRYNAAEIPDAPNNIVITTI